MFPAKDNLLPIAQVLKSYGTAGELLISFLPAMPDDIDINEPVFFIPEGLPVPFFIESFLLKGKNKAIIKLEDIDTLKEGDKYLNEKIYYPSNLCPNEDIEFLDGFSIFNQENRFIGVVSHTHAFSNNICVEVGDVLIPVHPDLILELDEEGRTMKLEIAEGLL